MSDYYRVTFKEASKPKGMATAAMVDCICCGEILGGSGGGSDHICKDCYHIIQSGLARNYFRTLRHVAEKGLA